MFDTIIEYRTTVLIQGVSLPTRQGHALFISYQSNLCSMKGRKTMKELQLTRGYFAHVDDDDHERLKHHNYFAVESSKPHLTYACRKSKGKRVWLAYDVLNLDQQEIKARRAAITYLDGNRLNCCKSNLSVQTRSRIIEKALKNK